MNEQCGNVHENKGSCVENPGLGANDAENKASYARVPGALLKTKGNEREIRKQNLEGKAARFRSMAWV